MWSDEAERLPLLPIGRRRAKAIVMGAGTSIGVGISVATAAGGAGPQEARGRLAAGSTPAIARVRVEEGGAGVALVEGRGAESVSHGRVEGQSLGGTLLHWWDRDEAASCKDSTGRDHGPVGHCFSVQ